MGLLAKASQIFELDNTVEKIINRISRIPKELNSPYNTLYLLKIYCSFESGICLSLENDNYVEYTSVGLGVGKKTVLENLVFSEERSTLPCFEFSDAEEKRKLNLMDHSTDIWCFPFDEAQPWNAVLIIGNTDSSFNKLVLAKLLKLVQKNLAGN